MRPTVQLMIATWVIAAVLALVYLTVETELMTWVYWEQGKRTEIVRNLGLLAAAVVGLGFGIWRAWTAHRQTVVAEQGLITDRFSTAIEHLGHDRVTVRIGGLYALKRIAEDSPERDHLAVMDVLTNFIRHPRHAAEQRKRIEIRLEAMRKNEIENGDAADGEDRIQELVDRPDIVAAIEIIQSRTDRQRAVEVARKYRLNLSRANVGYVRLIEVDLHDLDLTHANLMFSDLALANLTGANLALANLTLANLTGANLTGANLTFANLTGANLTFANLTDAQISRANLTGANLMGADLSQADLSRANLTGTNLKYAKNLTQSQLDSACIEKGGNPPTLPDGRNPPTNICPEN